MFSLSLSVLVVDSLSVIPEEEEGKDAGRKEDRAGGDVLVGVEKEVYESDEVGDEGEGGDGGCVTGVSRECSDDAFPLSRSDSSSVQSEVTSTLTAVTVLHFLFKSDASLDTYVAFELELDIFDGLIVIGVLVPISANPRLDSAGQ